MNIREHALSCLGEECIEVAKEVSKALRFGLDDDFRGKDTPRKKIQDEINDVLGAIAFLAKEGIIESPFEDVAYVDLGAVTAKMNKISKYMQYAKEHGTLLDS